MFGPKLKINKPLYDKVCEAAKLLGCSTVTEYVEKVLEGDTARVFSQSIKKGSSASQAEIQDLKNKLKGLGYIE